jgi:hypothetical protein
MTALRGLFTASAVCTVLLAGCAHSGDEHSSAAAPSADSSSFASGPDGLDASPTDAFASAGRPDSFAFEGPLFAYCTMDPVLISCVGVTPGPTGFGRIDIRAGAGKATVTPLTKAEIAGTPSDTPNLDRGSKLVIDNGRAVCGAVNSYTLACRLGDHGFRSEGSSTFDLY